MDDYEYEYRVEFADYEGGMYFETFVISVAENGEFTGEDASLKLDEILEEHCEEFGYDPDTMDIRLQDIN
jgi:DNA-directed RNA polymerase alpha subunit